MSLYDRSTHGLPASSSAGQSSAAWRSPASQSGWRQLRQSGSGGVCSGKRGKKGYKGRQGRRCTHCTGRPDANLVDQRQDRGAAGRGAEVLDEVLACHDFGSLAGHDLCESG